MAQSVLDRVLTDIQDLEPHELARVRDAVEDKLMPAPGADEEEQFLQALLASGLIAEIKRPNRGNRMERRTVPIAGKPLSETIIEERR